VEITLGRTLIVGVGGFLGAALRYLLGALLYRLAPSTFPYATMVVNVSGCFVIGLLAALAEQRLLLGPTSRLFWLVGVLGGYTTFSTFGWETFALAHEGSGTAALLNVAGQVLLGLAAVWLGVATARSLS
jgi:CrcB protein